jgi:hypothetical protein
LYLERQKCSVALNERVVRREPERLIEKKLQVLRCFIEMGIPLTSQSDGDH